jgi:hypothetical protein
MWTGYRVFTRLFCGVMVERRGAGSVTALDRGARAGGCWRLYTVVVLTLGIFFVGMVFSVPSAQFSERAVG